MQAEQSYVLTELPVTENLVVKAKKMQQDFNEIKISNKFPNRPTDFHGALGELMFKIWLKVEGIEGEWVDFVTNIPNDPDFTFFNGTKTLDVKTTRFNRLYFQKLEWDYYVLVKPFDFIGSDSANPRKVEIVGWMPKEEMFEIQQEIDSGNIERGNKEVRYGKKSYFIYPDTLKPMSELVSILKNGND